MTADLEREASAFATYAAEGANYWKKLQHCTAEVGSQSVSQAQYRGTEPKSCAPYQGYVGTLVCNFVYIVK